MGCCSSEDHFEKKSDIEPITKNPQFSWNTNQLQAKAFELDGANVRLIASKKKPYRLISKHPFPEEGEYIIKVRYVQKRGKGSFALGICHFGNKSLTDRVDKIGMKNVVRLFVSQKEGEIQNQGEVTFHSKSWGIKESDTVEMTVDIRLKTVEWRKQNNMDIVQERCPLPSSFNGKNLYLELIVYEPETELNVQAGKNE